MVTYFVRDGGQASVARAGFAAVVAVVVTAAAVFVFDDAMNRTGLGFLCAALETDVVETVVLCVCHAEEP